VLLLAITFACVFAGVIASSRRARVQVDLTGSGQHRLSERTRQILANLDGAYQVVVAGDLSSVDPLGRGRTLDVLDGFSRASNRVKVRIIDTATSAGLREFDDLLRDLALQHKDEVERQKGAVVAGASACDSLADALGRQSAAFLDAKGLVQDSDAQAGVLRGALDDDAARCRVCAERLTRSAGIAREALKRMIGATGVPEVDTGAKELGGALAGVSSDRGTVARRAEAIAKEASLPARVRERVGPIGLSVQQLRESADMAAERVSGLPALPLVAVARTLEKTSAALVIGPPRGGNAGGAGAAGTLRAIEFGDLFPTRRVDASRGATSLDLRSRAEELVSTALVSLGPAGAKAPIVVFVHDMPLRLEPSFQGLTGVVERLRLRGMDVAEWATALDADPPALTALNPQKARPVVYATFASAANTPEAAMRMKRMADAQNRLVSEASPVLLSMNVSTRPATRDADPLAECLAPLGVYADTGRPILRQVQGPNGRVVIPDHYVTEAIGEHPLAHAVNGLRCHFPWPVALTAAPAKTGQAPAASFEAVIRLRDKDAWAESEWLSFAQRSVADRAMLINPPSSDSAQDDASGDWAVVAAVERKVDGLARPQRAVVVGCSPWFFDDVSLAQLGVVDGRPVARAPGNVELFEASVYWLAGEDEMIARSATAESVPLIPNLAEGTFRLLRWVLILGLPIVVLLVGAALRLLRG
jgi:hypothetical protein